MRIPRGRAAVTGTKFTCLSSGQTQNHCNSLIVADYCGKGWRVEIFLKEGCREPEYLPVENYPSSSRDEKLWVFYLDNKSPGSPQKGGDQGFFIKKNI